MSFAPTPIGIGFTYPHSQINFCPHCGAKNNDYSYCPNCGKYLRYQSQPNITSGSLISPNNGRIGIRSNNTNCLSADD